MKVVEVENLCKEYPSFRLNDVSFSLEKGRITGFIGRNGAGKTTTIKSMLNLVHPSSGDVRFYGMSVKDKESEIKEMVGYSCGSVCYYPKNKIKDIIAVTKTFYPKWDDALCGKYLSLFNLDAEKTPSELSEGMKMKFSIMLALSHRADILILDEPTSGLDPFSRNELLDIFKNLRDGGATILFSTHIVSDLERCADSILYIKNGEIAVDSPMEEFKRNNARNGEVLEETLLRMEGKCPDF